MKILNWMRNKRNVKDGITNPDVMSYHKMHPPCNEEFSDWPNGLLAIGTFGSSNLKHSENFTTRGDLENTRPVNIEDINRQLRLILNKDISLGSSFPGESGKHNLSVEKFLDCCLREAERETGDESKSNLSERYLQRTTGIVHEGGKDIRSDKKKSGISKKSLSFLLKKVLLCRGGFVPAALIVKDPLLDPKFDNSRMEKILRAMLHKKIYPQRPTPKTTSRRYLYKPETESDKEENEEEASRRSKWVKTDSEYIVLEI